MYIYIYIHMTICRHVEYEQPFVATTMSLLFTEKARQTSTCLHPAGPEPELHAPCGDTLCAPPGPKQPTYESVREPLAW